MTNRDYNQAFLIAIIFIVIIVVFIMLLTINHLQSQINGLRIRNEILTDQIQEMNRYLKYPGG